MLRSLLKTAVATAVSSTRLDTLAHVRRHRHVPFVVFYHRVVEEFNASRLALPAMEITVATLERHLDWLGRNFQIVSIDDLDQKLENRTSTRPLAAVTFDDGYSDIYHHAFPLLRRKGIPAGVFIITDLIGSTQLPIHERLHASLVVAARRWTSMSAGLTEALRKAGAELSLPSTLDPFTATQFLLGHLPQAAVERIIDSLQVDADINGSWQLPLVPLTWEMLAEMRDSGMTIGSHTRTHAFLTNESPERVKEEADASRQDLEKRLGIAVQSFAYPGGLFNSSVVEAIATAGYRYAFTICRHRDRQHPMLTIPRMGFWQNSSLDPLGRFSSSVMSCQAAGAFRWMSRCRQTH